jgi:hypothetical protein
MFPLGADLGIEAIGGSQTVLFTQYVRVILPLDGFVFWVKADILSNSALAGALGYNTASYNEALSAKPPAKTFLASGSLHIAAAKHQEETETYGVNKVIFTSEDPLDQGFNEIDETHIYIGQHINGIRFAFSDRQNFYERAGIWHYVGDAIYPHMETQIIDTPGALNTNQLIVSNSLPMWLGLNNNIPFYGFGNIIPLYPSYLTQPNIRPPFCTVHIYPDSTQAMASAPIIGFRSDHAQLMRERVRIVMYGVQHDEAMTFVDAVNQYSSDYNFFGMMAVPSAIRDEKTIQDELSIIAQKKSIEYEISYNQNSVRNIARQIIGQAVPTFATIIPTFPVIQFNN